MNTTTSHRHLHQNSEKTFATGYCYNSWISRLIRASKRSHDTILLRLSSKNIDLSHFPVALLSFRFALLDCWRRSLSSSSSSSLLLQIPSTTRWMLLTLTIGPRWGRRHLLCCSAFCSSNAECTVQRYHFCMKRKDRCDGPSGTHIQNTGKH